MSFFMRLAPYLLPSKKGMQGSHLVWVEELLSVCYLLMLVSKHNNCYCPAEIFKLHYVIYSGRISIIPLPTVYQE